MFEYLLFLVQICFLSYLIIVLVRKGERYSKNLIIFNASIIVWVVSILSITVIKDLAISIWFARLTFVATTGAVCSYIYFFDTYTKHAKKTFTKAYNIVGLLIGVLSMTPLLIADMYEGSNVNYPSVVFGNFAIIYTLFVIVGVSFLIFRIYKLRKTTEGLEYLQVSYITVGMTIAGVFAISTNVVIPAITGDSASTFWGPIAVTMLSAITTYSFTRFRLFGIKYLIGLTIYYILLLSLPLLFFVILLNILSVFGLSNSDPVSYLIGLGGVVVFVPFYGILNKVLERVLNPAVGFKSSTSEKIREDFLKSISTELNIEKLGITALKAVDTIFDLRRSGVIIFNSDNSSIIYKRLYEFGDEKVDNQNLLQVIQYWEEVGHSVVLTREEILRSVDQNRRLSRILSFMNKNQIEIILPLNRKVHLNGVVILGLKNNKNPFTVEDIEYLESLVMNFSVAFSRSILYSQVEELNFSLQQKVNEQTKELQIKVEQLQEARKKERDMIDIMGHELRTPATVVKLNVELLEQFIDSNPKDFKKYLSRVKGAIDNEIKLINTLLSSAKLEGDKIEINSERINIRDEIEMSVHGHEMIASSKGLELVNDTQENISDIYADRARTVEVLNNLIDNAIKYTEEGSVTVKAEEDNGFVKVSVIDTGKGIAKEEIPKLGQKFHRIQNYIKSEEGFEIVRPGGTGLGLYVTFQLVVLMGGKIWVESEIDKGSKFVFTLPIYKGQKESGIGNNGSNDMFERLGLKR